MEVIHIITPLFAFIGGTLFGLHFVKADNPVAKIEERIRVKSEPRKGKVISPAKKRLLDGIPNEDDL